MPATILTAGFMIIPFLAWGGLSVGLLLIPAIISPILAVTIGGAIAQARLARRRVDVPA
jgi:hypothetical protein